MLLEVALTSHWLFSTGPATAKQEASNWYMFDSCNCIISWNHIVSRVQAYFTKLFKTSFKSFIAVSFICLKESHQSVNDLLVDLSYFYTFSYSNTSSSSASPDVAHTWGQGCLTQEVYKMCVVVLPETVHLYHQYQLRWRWISSS